MADDVAAIQRLRAELGADRRALEDRCEEVKRFAQPPPSEERSAALGLSLERAYTALEASLERIARSLEGGLPEADDWHRALLHGAGLRIETVRPEVLGAESIEAADELRRFRHFLRHAYAARLDPARLDIVAKRWLAALPALAQELDRFDEFLRQLAENLSRPA